MASSGAHWITTGPYQHNIRVIKSHPSMIGAEWEYVWFDRLVKVGDGGDPKPLTSGQELSNRRSGQATICLRLSHIASMVRR